MTEFVQLAGQRFALLFPFGHQPALGLLERFVEAVHGLDLFAQLLDQLAVERVAGFEGDMQLGLPAEKVFGLALGLVVSSPGPRSPG